MLNVFGRIIILESSRHANRGKDNDESQNYEAARQHVGRTAQCSLDSLSDFLKLPPQSVAEIPLSSSFAFGFAELTKVLGFVVAEFVQVIHVIEDVVESVGVGQGDQGVPAFLGSRTGHHECILLFQRMRRTGTASGPQGSSRVHGGGNGRGRSSADIFALGVMKDVGFVRGVG